MIGPVQSKFLQIKIEPISQRRPTTGTLRRN